MTDKIIKEFRDKFEIEYRQETLVWGVEEIEDFLTKALKQAEEDTLNELLKNGSGGGNWRRLILTKLSNLKEKE